MILPCLTEGLLEPISKIPSKENESTSQMSKGKEVIDMVFIANNEFSEILQPGKEPFDFPSSAVSPQHSAVLGGCFSPILFMGSDKLNTFLCQRLIQRITVVGPVSDQPDRPLIDKPLFESILDKGDFMRRSRRSVQGDRKTSAICHCHELRTLAPLGLSHSEAPFFATTKVASIKHSLRSNLPRSRRSVASASRIVLNTPELTHSWNLRWQV